MTIARMIIEIYALNHPTHQVSAVETLVNSLDIFFPSSAFAATFRACLLAVENKKVGAFTELNSFVEAHFDEVVTVLDRIRQTTLELQIILCYQRIDTMAEPPPGPVAVPDHRRGAGHLGVRVHLPDQVRDQASPVAVPGRGGRVADAVRVPLGQPPGR